MLTLVIYPLALLTLYLLDLNTRSIFRPTILVVMVLIISISSSLVSSPSFDEALALDGLLKSHTISDLTGFILLIAFFIWFTANTINPLIPLTNLYGLLVLVYSNDWLVAFISLELFNLTLYLLIGHKANGLKYLLLSSISSLILLLALYQLYLS